MDICMWKKRPHAAEVNYCLLWNIRGEKNIHSRASAWDRMHWRGERREKEDETINVNNKRCLNTNAQTNMDRGAKHYVLKRVINQRINAIKIFMHTKHIRARTRTLSQPLVHSLPIAGPNWICACMWRRRGSVFDCAVIAFVAIRRGPPPEPSAVWKCLDVRGSQCDYARCDSHTRARGEGRSAHGARRDAQPHRAGRERDRSATRRFHNK